MNSGNFDTKLTIEANTPVADAAGTLQPSWATFCQLWVMLEADTSGEATEADQKVGRTTYKCSTHRYNGILHSMRATVGGEYYDIKSVDYSDRYKMKLTIQKKDNQ